MAWLQETASGEALLKRVQERSKALLAGLREVKQEVRQRWEVEGSSSNGDAWSQTAKDMQRKKAFPKH